MTNAQKQQLKLDTEFAIKVFKQACGWEENAYEATYGPLDYKTVFQWPISCQLPAGACVSDMVLHIQSCRRLGCEPTMQSFACIMQSSVEWQDHLLEHDRQSES